MQQSILSETVEQNGTLKCAYTYLADGTKVMVQDNANSSSSNGYLYLGSMVFRKTGTSYAFESTDFGVGRIINVNGTLSPYYYTTDHLGNVRVITDALGNVTERNDYYAFGKRMTTGNTYPTTSSNRWKYNGKEVQTTGNVNWLDYGAREYDEVIGRWTRPDPMGEKYYFQSEYAYVGNNPIVYVDPTGMYIDESSQQEWERKKGDIKRQKDDLQNRINKLTTKAKAGGWSAEKLTNKIGDKRERITSLNNSLGIMDILENSSQGYSLSHTVLGEMGGVIFNHDTGIIDIKFGSENTAYFVHEMTHAGQFETGDIAFDAKTGNTIAQDVYDEIAAYKSQFAYDPTSISGLKSSSVANSFNSITTSWLQGLNGGAIYAPGGTANTGIGPLNVNSTRIDIINAYPNYPSLNTLPANYILKNFYPNIYYKK